MRKNKRQTFFIISLLALFGFYCKNSEKIKPDQNTDITKLKRLPDSAITQIQIDSAIKFYDTIPNNIPIRGSFTITNIGKKEMQLVSIQSGCGCLNILNMKSLLTKKILPQEEFKILFEILPNKEIGFISKGVTIIGNFHPFYRRLLVEAYLVNSK